MYSDLFKILVSQESVDSSYKSIRESALRIVNGNPRPGNHVEAYLALVWPLCTYRNISPFDRSLLDMSRENLILETFMWRFQSMTPEERSQDTMKSGDAKVEMDGLFDDWDTPVPPATPPAAASDEWKDAPEPDKNAMDDMMKKFMETGDFVPPTEET